MIQQKLELAKMTFLGRKEKADLTGGSVPVKSMEEWMSARWVEVTLVV